MRALRFAGGLAVGFLCAAAIGRSLLTALLAVWPEYAAAMPDKSYSLPMLWSRLGVATVLILVSASACTLVAGERRSSVVLGALFVVVSLPSHLHYSRAAYPVWYHALYLLSIVPLAWLGGGLVARGKTPTA